MNIYQLRSQNHNIKAFLSQKSQHVPTFTAHIINSIHIGWRVHNLKSRSLGWPPRPKRVGQILRSSLRIYPLIKMMWIQRKYICFQFLILLVTHRPPISQPMTFLILRPGLLVQGLAVAPVLIINLTHFGWRVFDLKGRSVGWPGWLGQIWILNIQTYSLINWLKFNTYLTTHEYEGLSLPDIDSGAFWKRYFLIQVLLFWTLGLRQNKALTSLLRWESWWGGGRRSALWRRSRW